jgi:hypothetical protein
MFQRAVEWEGRSLAAFGFRRTRIHNPLVLFVLFRANSLAGGERLDGASLHSLFTPKDIRRSTARDFVRFRWAVIRSKVERNPAPAPRPVPAPAIGVHKCSW